MKYFVTRISELHDTRLPPYQQRLMVNCASVLREWRCVRPYNTCTTITRTNKKKKGRRRNKKKKKEAETLGDLQRGCSQWLLKNGQLKDYVLSLTNRVITSTIKLILKYDS